jgi:hypothetical protein
MHADVFVSLEHLLRFPFASLEQLLLGSPQPLYGALLVRGGLAVCR